MPVLYLEESREIVQLMIARLEKILRCAVVSMNTVKAKTR